MNQPKRHLLTFGNPVNQKLFCLRWPDGRWELDLHLAPLSCYRPVEDRTDPKNQLKDPTPELLAGLDKDETTRFLGAVSYAKRLQIVQPGGLVMEHPVASA